MTENFAFARRGLNEAEYGLEEGGFACSIRPSKPVALCAPECSVYREHMRTIIQSTRFDNEVVDHCSRCLRKGSLYPFTSRYLNVF